MPTLDEYFRTEARDFLNALERSLQRAPGPDAAELHRTVRGLRGTAQMAREQRIFDVVSAFESVTRAIAGGALTWSDSIAARARETIGDLRVLLDRTEEDEQLDARVDHAASRWREADPDPHLAVSSGPPTVDPGTREFREFTAREAAGIADALDRGVNDLLADPMNREPLTSILRRQRALLGSARLDEIPVVADILRAVEDLSRVIVKLDVGVKKEWLDIYRVARDALQTTIAPLLRDELPEPSHAVSRLRHMREELLERYGSTVEPPPPAEDPLASATLAHPAATFLASAPSHPTDPSSSAIRQDAGHISSAAVTDSSPAAEGDASLAAEGDASPHGIADPSPPAEEDASSGAGNDELPSGPTDSSPASTPYAQTYAPAHPPTITGKPGPALGSFDSESGAGSTTPETGDHGVEDDGDPDMLELTADSVVDDEAGMLELTADSVVEDDADMLETTDSAVEDDTGTLELTADKVAADDTDMLELTADSVIEDDAGMLELSADSIVSHETGVLEFHQGIGADDTADTPSSGARMYSRQEALQRALELRDIVSRVAAHDPQARAAVEELFDLIRIALE